MSKQIEAMKQALEEAERAWRTAEASIETARRAAEKANDACGTVRSNWHPNDGEVILDFYDAASRVAVPAGWRAARAQKGSPYIDHEISAGFISFYALEAKFKEKNA